MQDIAKTRIKIRKKRQTRIRRTISGTTERPRLCVRRSLKHMVAQIIDDTTGTSLVQLSTSSKSFLDSGSKVEISKKHTLKIF